MSIALELQTVPISAHNTLCRTQFLIDATDIRPDDQVVVIGQGSLDHLLSLVRAGCRSSAAIRSHELQAPFFARGMLMRPDDGGVDHDIFEVGIISHCGEQSIPYAVFGPTRESDEHAVPIAKNLRQIPPRRASSRQPKHCLKKQTIVFASSAGVTFLAGKVRLYPVPLVVLQNQTNPGQPSLLPEKEFESEFRVRGNRPRSVRSKKLSADVADEADLMDGAVQSCQSRS